MVDGAIVTREYNEYKAKIRSVFPYFMCSKPGGQKPSLDRFPHIMAGNVNL